MEFHELLGEELIFYGVDNLLFKLDDTIWEVIEDPDDGYRSCLGAIKAVDDGVFYRDPLAIVTVAEDSEGACNGYALIESVHNKDSNYTWLRFGTDRDDEYYPQFYFHYSPKPPSKPILNKTNKDIDPLDILFEQREY